MLKRRKFTKMYDEYADDIFRFLMVHVRDPDLAEDLTADTFTKAWRSIDKFDGENSRAWLYKIAQNSLTDHWRRKKPLTLDEAVEVVDDAPSLDDRVDADLEAERLMTAVQKLPEPMRSVVSLRFMQGYSVRQTAEVLELTESNVRVVQYRALKKMRGLLS